LKKAQLLNLAGILWGIIGAFLLVRGMQMYQLAMGEQNASQGALAISLGCGLALGAVKGFFVLPKTANRNKLRIQNLPSPLKIYHIFSKPFYGLIAGMILLGILLRTWNEYLGGYIVVAAIYCGIGLALILASRVYWGDRIPAQNEA
jgi:hypothetical protein